MSRKQDRKLKDAQTFCLVRPDGTFVIPRAGRAQHQHSTGETGHGRLGAKRFGEKPRAKKKERALRSRLERLALPPRTGVHVRPGIPVKYSRPWHSAETELARTRWSTERHTAFRAARAAQITKLLEATSKSTPAVVVDSSRE